MGIVIEKGRAGEKFCLISGKVGRRINVRHGRK